MCAVAITADAGLDIGIGEQCGQAGGSEARGSLVGIVGIFGADADIGDLEYQHRTGILHRDAMRAGSPGQGPGVGGFIGETGTAGNDQAQRCRAC